MPSSDIVSSNLAVLPISTQVAASQWWDNGNAHRKGKMVSASNKRHAGYPGQLKGK
jgi:hypothetical protein